MAVDLEFGSIGFRRGFHPGRRNQGNNLAGGSREAQGASIALDHVQINGISVRTGRLVLVEQPDPVVELARTSGNGSVGASGGGAERDGAAGGALDSCLAGSGVPGAGPFEGMLVAQSNGALRIGPETEGSCAASFTPASGVFPADFQHAFTVVGIIRVAAEGVASGRVGSSILVTLGLSAFLLAFAGTGARAAFFFGSAGGRREGTGTGTGAGAGAGAA